jgi:hypothetical protein
MQSSVASTYAHVYLTIQGVWFNTSASATPDDTTWKKFPLSAPITIDLATLNNGTLAQIASDLKVPAGTYSQIRLIPIDPFATLATSASGLGAKYNAEVDYTDSSDVNQQAPLELLNPDKGIGVSTTLTIKASLSQLTSIGTSTTGTNCVAGDITCGQNTSSTTCAAGDPTCQQNSTGTTPVTTTPGTTTTPVTTTPVATTSPSSATTASVAVTVDGLHDLVQFNFGGQIGFLLNPHPSAFDVSTTGTLKGSIDLTNIASSVSSSQQVAVQVIAESLSKDGSRHVVVKSAQVASDGTFVLYPLPLPGLGSAGRYDLVVHGPQIATVIIKSVPVAAGDPTSTSAVSVGKVSARAATPFTFNLAPGSPALPAGALVDVYQTLPGSGEVPYVVDQVPIDPFARSLFSDESLPTGTVDTGTYFRGGNVSLAPATPVQGVSTYLASGQASLFSQGGFSTPFGPPSSGSGPVGITVPSLAPAAGATSASMSITVTPAVANHYDHGELIVSHDGAIVQTVVIDSALTQNGGVTLLIPGIPGGGSASSFDNAVYYVSTRAWNSSNPAGTLARQSFPSPVDLSAGSVTGLSVTVD